MGGEREIKCVRRERREGRKGKMKRVNGETKGIKGEEVRSRKENIN